MTKMIDLFQGEFRFLSNFFPAIIEFEGEIYTSVEHAFQAAKSHDKIYRQMVRTARTPGEAKQLGAKAPLRGDWQDVKIYIMEQLVLQKFQRSASLKKMLLATGDALLIEGNNWNDRFWGMCGGSGNNHLGIILMNVRSKLK